MSWRDLVTAARSCVVGWGALFAIIFLIERPLLYLAASIVDASWLPTVELALECLSFAAIGWLIGRWGNIGVVSFAATLAVSNLGLIPGIDLPWLFHLLLDCFQNVRYLEPFFTSLATHSFLFASLFVGSHLSRASEQTVLHIK
jgi:hypothetical protein